MNKRGSIALFYENFLYLCNTFGKSPNKVASELGLSSSIVTYWSKGKQPRDATIHKIAEYFHVPAYYLVAEKAPSYVFEGLQTQNTYPVQGLYSMPIVGSVRAGYGTSPMIDYEDEYVSIPTEQMRGYKASECRIIRVKGDSMYPKILDGDLVLIHVQPDIENDETAVVFNGGDEATIKKIRILPDHIEMIPANSQYETKIIAGTDLKECRIYGKVLSLIRNF